MNYIKNYQTRLSAKTHKTRLYSEKELSLVRSLIKQYLTTATPYAVLNSNEANYTALADAINSFYKEEVISARFVYDIYRQNSDSQKKNIRKMNAIIDFVQNHYLQNISVEPIENSSNLERLLHRIDELQGEMKTMMLWMQQLTHKMTTQEEYNPFRISNENNWQLQKRA